MTDLPPNISEPEQIKALVDINLAFAKESPTPDQRSEHGKGVADLRATFTVLDHLPADCRVGLFAKPGSHDAIIRFSNSAMQRDDKRDTHGMAVKVLDVPMPTAPRDATGVPVQDFIFIDSPVFVIGDLRTYIPFDAAFMEAKLNLMGKLRMGLLVLRNLHLLPVLLRLALRRANAPLSVSYWSTTPYRLGPEQVVKYKVMPIGPNRPAPRIRGKDGRRRALKTQLDWGPGLFSFGVILRNTPKTQPIDNPRVDWEEQGARFVPLAEISIPSDQPVEAPADMENDLAFSPGHASVEHYPMGAINRARVAIYAAAQEARKKAAADRATLSPD